MPKRRYSAVLAILVALLVSIALAAGADLPADKYQWLEDVWGKRSIAWVKAANQRTAAVLEQDKRFPVLRAEALAVLESRERLPLPAFFAGSIYNFWQDVHSVRGVLRRTSLGDYLEPSPHWQTVIDYDQLSKSEGKSWVRKGQTCLPPENEHCLIALSEGGEDAITQREFNMKTGRFVPGGFVLPHSKQRTAWVDADTLLVALDWGPGSLTTAGYPFILKRWKRGQPLSAAEEVFRGKQEDTAVDLFTASTGAHASITFVRREIDFFRAETHVYQNGHLRPVPAPRKSHFDAVVSGQMILTVDEDWRPDPAGPAFSAGSVVSLDAAALQRDPVHLRPRLLFAPTPREFPQSVSSTRNLVLLSTLDNVRGRLYSFRRTSAGPWEKTPLNLPDNRTVSVVGADDSSDSFVLSVQGFLTPSSLWLGDGDKPLRQVKTLPPQFNAADLTAEQLDVASTDGARIPYFVVHKRAIPYDGSNPTILTAYGGFQLSSTPTYSPTYGKLWLERGGVLVVANIRGGGEFGPAWHEAGLTTHRQRIYDDFASVARDLLRRKITSPRRLGISGASNGGLLVGVQMTQHPDLWNAVDIEVPLLDMLRFEKIAAGSSWISEYGSVSDPEQRSFLASISPYHQLKAEVHYPEPFVFTTTRDDRVGPVHARKFAARLQELNKPFYYYEILEGGHGAGADLKETARSTAVRFVYFIRKLMDDPA